MNLLETSQKFAGGAAAAPSRWWLHPNITSRDVEPQHPQTMFRIDGVTLMSLLNIRAGNETSQSFHSFREGPYFALLLVEKAPNAFT